MGRGKRRANEKALSQYIASYCEAYAGQIPVREKDPVTRRLGSFFLSELPRTLRKRHIKRFRAEQRCPTRLFTPAEQAERDRRNQMASYVAGLRENQPDEQDEEKEFYEAERLRMDAAAVAQTRRLDQDGQPLGADPLD